MPPRNRHCKYFALAQYHFVFMLHVGMFWSMCCGSYVSLLSPWAFWTLRIHAQGTAASFSCPWLLLRIAPTFLSICRYTEHLMLRILLGTHARSKCQISSPPLSPAPPPSQSSQSKWALGFPSRLHAATAPASLLWEPLPCTVQSHLNSATLHHLLPDGSSSWAPSSEFLCCGLSLKAQLWSLMTWFQPCLCHSWLWGFGHVTGAVLSFLGCQEGLMVLPAMELVRWLQQLNHLERQHSSWHLISIHCKLGIIILPAMSRGGPNASVSPSLF